MTFITIALIIVVIFLIVIGRLEDPEMNKNTKHQNTHWWIIGGIILMFVFPWIGIISGYLIVSWLLSFIFSK
jgi:hypothetical protein